MWFGKHKGRPLEKVPANYLLFLYDKDDGFWRDDSYHTRPMDLLLKRYIEANYAGLRMEDKNFEPCHPYRKPR